MSNTCIDCEEARQVCNKERQDVVGCRLLNVRENHHLITTGTIYEAWFYGGRRPYDIAESKEIGKGVMTNGIVIDATGHCRYFSERPPRRD